MSFISVHLIQTKSENCLDCREFLRANEFLNNQVISREFTKDGNLFALIANIF